MNVQQAYTHWSATYDLDRNLTRDLDQQVTKETLVNRHYQSILEIGCGTGKNTAFLVTIGDTVRALDFSEGMIRIAQEKVLSPNVSFLAADLTQPWPCESGTIDLIACNLVLEHIENLSFIFAEAARVLENGGQFFLCELHPFRQYQGTKANFQRGQDKTEIPAFVHHLSDFTNAATHHGLSLQTFQEWWHEEDTNKPPRLISFLFEKRLGEETA